MTVDASIRRTELKAFLRARRAALLPEACGIQHGRRRLTPGLRREEIAAIANVGVTWYTWLEQGRPINVAAATMRRISQALRLSPTDETYLFSLAGLERTEKRSPDIAVSPALSTVLDMYEGPAFVLGPLTDVLAFNSIADRLYDFNPRQGRFACNHLWAMFVNPARRSLYLDFDDCIPRMLGIVRMSYASRIGDPDFESFIADLSDASPEFARLWTERWTSPLAPPVNTRMIHPAFGQISVHSTRFPIDAADGSIIVFLAPADAATRDVFRSISRADLGSK